MTYIFLRTYEKDDYIARLCYESWMLVNPHVHFIFYSEQYQTKWLKDLPNTEWIFREHCGNYGGQQGARNLMNGFRQFHFNDEDIIISCDTDVVIKENPLEDFTADFGGGGGFHPQWRFTHIGGALMIFRWKVLKELLKDPDNLIGERVDNMVKKNIDVCDDTYLSLRLHDMGVKAQVLKGKWVHYKYYDREPRTDWQTIVDEII